MSTTAEAVEKKTLDAVYEERNMYFLLALALADQCGARVGMRERYGMWKVCTIEFPGMAEWAIHMHQDEVPVEMYLLPNSPPYQPRERERTLKLETMRVYVTSAVHRRYCSGEPVQTCAKCNGGGERPRAKSDAS